MVGLQGTATAPALDDALVDDSFDGRIRSLVGRLRERQSGGVRDALDGLLAERDHALGDRLSTEAWAILKRYEALILAALSTRYDALDSALVDTSFAVAEIDGDGLISYANHALLRLVPDALGRPFAPLFGLRTNEVQKAIASDERETLWLDLVRDNQPPIHLRGEIGPLTDELGRSGAYALLLSLTDEEARFDTAPYGLLRLDVAGVVAFANREAEKLFGGSRGALIGRPVEELFDRTQEAVDQQQQSPTGTDVTTTDPQWQSLTGIDVTTNALPLDGGNPIAVRVGILPSLEKKTGAYAGAMLAIRPCAKELAVAEINRLLTDPDIGPKELARGVMAAIKPIVPFDFATFSLMSDDMKHSQVVVVHPEPTKWKWTTAWFPLGPGVAEFLRSDKTWGRDLSAAVQRYAPGVTRNEVVVNLVENERMIEFLTLPIEGGKGAARGSLTLMSKKFDNDGDGYGIADLQQLRELRVDSALQLAEANLARRRTRRMARLSERLTAAPDYHSLATALAEGISGCFGWDYVGVYGIDRERERFLLIAQRMPAGEPAATKKEEQQSLSQGTLGQALRDGVPINVAHVGDAASEYRPALSGARSAWATPLRVTKRPNTTDASEIEWILSVESRLDNAFEGPDMVALRQLVEQCENILGRRWQRAMQEALLSSAEQALVVVSRTGVVQLTNRQAKELFCRSGELVGARLESLGATEPDRWLLQSAVEVSKRRVTLVSAEGERGALATQRLINDDYEHRLWLFTDLNVVPRKAEGLYLEETVSEVAQSTRLPLLLAGSLLRGAASKLLEHRGARGLLEKAISQIGKADITYERLATASKACRG